VSVGDLWLVNRATGLNGGKNADAQTFSLSVAGAAEISGEISARLADDVVVYVAYRHGPTGNIDFKSEIMRGTITDLYPTTGGRSSTLIVSCRALNSVVETGMVHAVEGVEYYKAGSSPSVRGPISFGVEVGDTVMVGGDGFVVGKVSYNVDYFSRIMTVSG